MCQMYVLEKNIVIPRPFWDAIEDYNPHGVGIYNICRNEIKKFVAGKTEEAWLYVNEHKADRLVVHHRLATSGAKSEAQLHGWLLENGHVFFHNGIMSTYRGTLALSDTQEFVAEWTDARRHHIMRYLEECETSSRFILVDSQTGEIHIPKCATWNPVFIKEINTTIKFSNSYAFNYGMLPASYNRWTSSKGVAKTRDGSYTTKKPDSALDRVARGSVYYEGKVVYDAQRKLYVGAHNDLYQIFINTTPYNGKDRYYIPSVMRFGEKVYFPYESEDPTKVTDAPYLTAADGNCILMSDVMNAPDKYAAYEYIALAIGYAKLDMDVMTAAKAIRSYEIQVGNKKGVRVWLVDYLKTFAAALRDHKAFTAVEVADGLAKTWEEFLWGKASYIKAPIKTIQKRLASVLWKASPKPVKPVKQTKPATSANTYSAKINNVEYDWDKDKKNLVPRVVEDLIDDDVVLDEAAEVAKNYVQTYGKDALHTAYADNLSEEVLIEIADLETDSIQVMAEVYGITVMEVYDVIDYPESY